MAKETKYLLRFPNGRYLKSFTLDGNGEVDDITTTIKKDKAMLLSIDEAVEYKADLFKFLKPSIENENE